MRQCQALLTESSLETAVRVGDVYGLLVEHFAQRKDYNQVGRKGGRKGERREGGMKREEEGGGSEEEEGKGGRRKERIE